MNKPWEPHYLEIKYKALSVSEKYQSGMTVKEISKLMGMPLGTIYRYLRYTGDMKGRIKDEKTGRFVISKK
jgi:hypothetical protein